MSDPVNAARGARENLRQGLAALQAPGVPENITQAAEPVAQAMGALHQIEASGGTAVGQHAPVALEAVRRALGMLQAYPTNVPAVQQALEAVAGSLTLVHQLSQSVVATAATQLQQPSPVAHMQPGMPAPAQPVHAPAQPMQPPAGQAPAWGGTHVMQPTGAHPQAPVQPAPAQAPQPQQYAPQPPQQYAPQPQQPQYAPQQPQYAAPQQPQYAPQPQQQYAPQPQYVAPAQGQAPQPAGAPGGAAWQPSATPGQAGAPAARAPGGAPLYVEAELGAHSATNFYKGLSGNDVIDSGGIFIATYQIPEIGQTLMIKVSLPGGYEFEAAGVVRWTRDAPHSTRGAESPPGFGAQFTNISQEGRQLVYRYVRNREPLFHDDL